MEKEDCSICFFPYDKKLKVPRVLHCGHTFCQTCLEEIKLPHKNTITCPNCRLLTENVKCTRNLPENEGVFNQVPTFANLNSPYEVAKRLSTESETMIKTAECYFKYLKSLEEIDLKSEERIIKNYESEYEKIETTA